MKKDTKLFKMLAFSFVLVLFFASCHNLSSSFAGRGYRQGSLSITSWNIQTFFDTQTSGREYSDFIGTKLWNDAVYVKRLERLCQTMEALSSDLFIFQEIENEAVLVDIVNYLKTQGNPALAYSHAVFIPSRDDVLGCAILSRYPIISCTTHQIDYRFEGKKQPDTRPLMEVLVQAHFSKPLRVYTSHWKSKSGGAEQSEFWRDAQEALIARRIRETGDQLYVFAADCNRDLSEFAQDGQHIVLDTEGQRLKTQSPYLFDAFADEDGTYFFQKEWNKIDHFFIGEALHILSFCIERKGLHVDKDGIPYRFSIWNGQGYSDHLPISCVVSEKMNKND
ncbi:MAG TPA: hypothetical protein PK505_00425 [Treponemataceae bacterium]|nr:hypothetical protein [Treponemataceae bacterium]